MKKISGGLDVFGNRSDLPRPLISNYPGYRG